MVCGSVYWEAKFEIFRSLIEIYFELKSGKKRIAPFFERVVVFHHILPEPGIFDQSVCVFSYFIGDVSVISHA